MSKQFINGIPVIISRQSDPALLKSLPILSHVFSCSGEMWIEARKWLKKNR